MQDTCQWTSSNKESHLTNPIIEQVRRYLYDNRQRENIFQIFSVDVSLLNQGKPILCDKYNFEQVLKQKMLIYC